MLEQYSYTGNEVCFAHLKIANAFDGNHFVVDQKIQRCQHGCRLVWALEQLSTEREPDPAVAQLFAIGDMPRGNHCLHQQAIGGR